MQNVSLYIHIPFCQRKCLFCSFAVSIGQSHRSDEYVSALLCEAQRYRRRGIQTMYWGGGTPSSLTELQMKHLVQGIKETFEVIPDGEMTLEANPEDITAEKLSMAQELGFNRLSVGVQSFNDRYLKFLGRAHDSRRAREALSLVQSSGWKNFSIDLMYGFPGQTETELLEDIKEMSSMNSTHVSIYTLTIEQNSRFYAQAIKLDDDEKLARHYEMIVDQLSRRGFQQYEVSNFAKCGFESKHNDHYWQGGEYIGLGMGAHSYLQAVRSWNHDKLNLYLDAVTQDKRPCAGQEILSAETISKERLIFGLRRNQGLNDVNLLSTMSESLRNILQKEIENLIQDGFLLREAEQLKVTPKGRLVLDEIAVRLI